MQEHVQQHVLEAGLPDAPALPAAAIWLHEVQAMVGRTLAALLDEDEAGPADPRWARALALLRAYTLRPAKRVRPALVLVGYALSRRTWEPSAGARRFAAGVELLHTFTLIHDDVADGADVRRGGPALHRALARERLGESLAVVVGDYVFVRAVATMLGAGLPGAAEATRYCLDVLRDTAMGQYLDIAHAPLAATTLEGTLRLAYLKTATLGFVGPLVAGAVLGEGEGDLVETLRAVGHEVGVAFQLRDDLLALFGDAVRVGKPAEADLAQAKPTFPVVAAYLRAPEAARRELERLWSAAGASEGALPRVGHLVEAYGGRVATEQTIARATRRARELLEQLPEAGGARDVLSALVESLAGRDL